jgi:hypothetical protein
MDDHNAPAFISTNEGLVGAAYTQHHLNDKVFFAKFLGAIRGWQQKPHHSPSPDSKVTYSNLFRVRKTGRIYNFYRGMGDSFKPSWSYSDDDGESWKAGGVLIDFPNEIRHRPYFRASQDQVGNIHFVFTEGHPRDFDNNLYHAFLDVEREELRCSDGTLIGPLSHGIPAPSNATLLFSSPPTHAAWPIDVRSYPDGRLQVLYSLRGKMQEPSSSRIYYALGLWDGQVWSSAPLVPAGPALYESEQDYTGLGAISGQSPNTIFISTKIHPVTGEDLDNWSIFQGTRGVEGWSWQMFFSESGADSIRPIWLSGAESHHLLWLKGTYRSYRDYSLSVMMKVIN